MNKTIVFFLLVCIVLIGCTDKTTIPEHEQDPIMTSKENLIESKNELLAWNDSINFRVEKMRQGESEIMVLVESANIKNADQPEVNRMKTALAEMEAKRVSLIKLYDVVLQLFTIKEANFLAFTEKAKEGNLSEEEINKELNFYNTNFESVDNDVTTFNGVLDDLEYFSGVYQKTLGDIVK